MPYETDERLKSFLDTNQLAREQMCLAVMAIDRRFSQVRSRHPRGGPDGARDIEAVFNGAMRTSGAVGFLNQANDSDAHRKSAADKFTNDLTAALKQEPPPEVFVFFTNVNLTLGEKDRLVALARSKGIKHAEVFDRERIRIELDGADGFGVRFQYLQIPLSEAEQATFFARWGDDIQGVISAGFGRVQGALNRILFLQEAALPLDGFSAVFELNREYRGSEIGHFRLFGSVFLKGPSYGTVAFLFGTTDNRARLQARTADDLAEVRSGITESMCGAQWEMKVLLDQEKPESERPEAGEEDDDNGDEGYPFLRVGSFTSVGRDPVKAIAIHYDKDSLFRLEPGPRLMDVNDCRFIFYLNEGLARKVKTIRIYANEYELKQIGVEDFRMHHAQNKPNIPLFFDDNELGDPWVVVAPPVSSTFRVTFSEHTPRRFFAPKDIEER